MSPSFVCTTPLDDLWSPHSDQHRSKAVLLSSLNAQRSAQLQTIRDSQYTERKNDLAAIARWKGEIGRAKLAEIRDKERKRELRVQLEKDYKREYQERAGLAAKERAEEEAHMRRMIKLAQEEDRKADEQKVGFKRMFQELIRVNEVQKQRAVGEYQSELKHDIQMQKAQAAKLAQQDAKRELEIKSRVFKQHLILVGETARLANSETVRLTKKEEQDMYRRVLDKQVQEHRERDWREWEGRQRSPR